jgi:hypothetical protein
MSGKQSAVTPVTTSTPAERLRSLLVTAGSLTLHTPGHRADIAGRHHVTDGRLMVELPEDSCLARHLARDGELVAMIEVTDLAPVPFRDRVRSRATLTGWLTPVHTSTEAADLVAVLDLATAELTTADRTASIDPTAFADARPDPLAAGEAELLCHLNDHHPETVELLSRLVPPPHLRHVRAVRPLRLDRFGIVLRLEYADRHRDVRLDFSTPLEDPDQLSDQVETLLAAIR